uniref:T9SS type A sorting domain-containing protein n=1 Tax=candidate division WOR-3 bacterium TaxID=2052148 RepID=A0A7C6ECB8_UNCW3
MANGWRWTVSVIRDSIPVGIEEDREPLDVHPIRADRLPLEIYPNPAKTYCAIRLPPTADRQSALGGLKIFDVSGKMIKEVVMPAGKSEIKIPFKGMNPGIILIQLGTEVKKFLVVK